MALHIFFFPFLAHGHIIPMARLARLFAKRGINSTIITTPANATFVHSILGPNSHSVNLLLLPFPPTSETNLPIGCENTSSLPQPHSLHVLNIFKAIDLLKEPLNNLLLKHRPDFLISDWIYTWTTDLAQSIGIPRLVFQTFCAFSIIACELVHKHKSYVSNIDNSTPFQIPLIPHRIGTRRDELPIAFNHPSALDQFRDAEIKSYGTVLNSFYELEPSYVELVRGTRKLWCVGPVGYGETYNNDNRQVKEKIIEWLDSKGPATVIYICFGSECIFETDQIKEMARGLEDSQHPFVWVLRSDNYQLPYGFEKRMKPGGEGKGFIIRGWAPQVMILNHPAIGGFMTHCGWNSILEGVCAGLPMVAWPLHSEQFINEKLVVEVLMIGVRVREAAHAVIDKDTVRKLVELVMGRGEESLERKRRAKEYQAKARKVLEEGGSSYQDLSHLIEEMMKTVKERTSMMKDQRDKISKSSLQQHKDNEFLFESTI